MFEIIIIKKKNPSADFAGTVLTYHMRPRRANSAQD
jgi:hypothetical protein